MKIDKCICGTRYIIYIETINDYFYSDSISYIRHILVGTKNDIPDFTFLERMKSMSTSLWNDITTKEFLPSSRNRPCIHF